MGGGAGCGRACEGHPKPTPSPEPLPSLSPSPHSVPMHRPRSHGTAEAHPPPLRTTESPVPHGMAGHSQRTDRPLSTSHTDPGPVPRIDGLSLEGGGGPMRTRSGAGAAALALGVRAFVPHTTNVGRCCPDDSPAHAPCGAVGPLPRGPWPRTKRGTGRRGAGVATWAIPLILPSRIPPTLHQNRRDAQGMQRRGAGPAARCCRGMAWSLHYIPPPPPRAHLPNKRPRLPNDLLH